MAETIGRQTGFATPAPAPDREARTQALLESLEERILVLDGATGTALQGYTLTAADFGGPELEGCNENLCRTRPDVVRGLSEFYLAAGADIVETNSFGSTPLVLAEYGLADHAFELSRLSAALAREACARFDAPGRLRFVCGAMGPTTKAISVTGGVTFEELIGHYHVQALGLMAGGADYLLLETCQDTRNVKAGLLAIERAFEACGWRLPVAVSVTLEPTGTMLAGQDAEALAVSLGHADLLYVGVNCATGPALMADHLRTFSELCRTRVACVPNAGLPDEEGKYREGPEVFREVFGRFLDAGWLNLVGGCCGTTDAHVRALVELAAGRRPRPIPHHQRALVSGLEAVELTADNRPLLVGERTNVLGSRKFKDLVAAGAWEPAAEVGRAQVRAGAQVVDVCLQDPDRDELADIDAFLDRLTRLIKAPLMIDSTDARVMERALAWCQGKAILNSINLEDGRARFDKVVPLARRFGAALVVGLIDEKGMAVSVERKVEVARRSFAILTEEMEVPPEDLWFDALVFPCGTGDENYVGSAAATIEGVRRIKAEFPLVEDGARRLERLVRTAARRPRGAQLGLPLPRDTGRARRRDRQHRAARPLCRDPGSGAQARRGADLPRRSATRRRGRRRSPPSPSTSAAARAPRPGRRARRCRSTSGWRGRSSKAPRSGSRRISPPRSPSPASPIRWRSSTARSWPA